MLRSLRVAGAVAIFLVLGIAGRAEARDDALVELLSGIEWVPGPHDLAARGKGAADLMGLYGDGDVPLIVQVRAVELLVNYPRPDVSAFLQRVARRGGHAAMLRAVCGSLGVFGADVAPTLSRLAAHSDRSVREAAVRALGRIGAPAAWDALRRRRGVETEPNVRHEIDIALAAAP